jgi:redox-sensitive bicupin YhaK (pirin superfamily)
MGTRRHAYLVPAVGKIEVNGVVANSRDGVAITNETVVTVKAIDDSEVVLVDSP